MAFFLRLIIKFTLLATLYFLALYHYAPSDVTQGHWLFKPGIIFLFLRILGLLLIFHFVKSLFFASGQSFIGRIFRLITGLPFYALLSALLMFSLNGTMDDKTRTAEWQTNLVYFKNFKIACITAGIDNAQIAAEDLNPQIMFVPGKLCNHIPANIAEPTDNRKYIITLSSGAFSIPYIIDIKQ